MNEFVIDIICKMFGHKISTHITQPDSMAIDWCDRCGKYESFLEYKNTLRAKV